MPVLLPNKNTRRDFSSQKKSAMLLCLVCNTLHKTFLPIALEMECNGEAFFLPEVFAGEYEWKQIGVLFMQAETGSEEV